MGRMVGTKDFCILECRILMLTNATDSRTSIPTAAADADHCYVDCMSHEAARDVPSISTFGGAFCVLPILGRVGVRNRRLALKPPDGSAHPVAVIDAFVAVVSSHVKFRINGMLRSYVHRWQIV